MSLRMSARVFFRSRVLALLALTAVILLVVIVLLRQQQESLTVEMTKRGRAIAENLAAGAKTSLLQRDDLTLTVLVKDGVHHTKVGSDGINKLWADVANRMVYAKQE